MPMDDPIKRKPVIDRAIKSLDWKPTVDFNKGVDLTIKYFTNISFLSCS